MIKCGRTGATILYGTSCVRCNCHHARREHWGDPPRALAVEIISDPNDHRGIDARQIGRRA